MEVACGAGAVLRAQWCYGALMQGSGNRCVTRMGWAGMVGRGMCRCQCQCQIERCAALCCTVVCWTVLSHVMLVVWCTSSNWHDSMVDGLIKSSICCSAYNSRPLSTVTQLPSSVRASSPPFPPPRPHQLAPIPHPPQNCRVPSKFPYPHIALPIVQGRT